MAIHDRIKEKVASGIGRGGFRGYSCMGVHVLDGVIGGEARGGVFPNQPLGGRLTSTTGRGRHRRLGDSLVCGELGEQGEGTLDLVGLAVRSLFSHVDAEGVGAVPVEVIVSWRGNYGCCAKDGFPSTPEHPDLGKWVGGRVRLQPYYICM